MPSTESRSSVRAYVDLSSADIQRLTKIFAYDDRDTVKACCRSLPSHLRWRFSFTSPFCTTHEKVNFFPVEHIFYAMKDTIQEELSAVWMPMARHGTLEPLYLDHVNIVRNNPALVQKDCIACSLAAMALDVHLLVAVGAIHLASLRPKVWNKSKRIQWLEHCLLGRVELQHQKEIVREMWETGTNMRKLRDAWKNGDGAAQQNNKKRGYIDEFSNEAEQKDPPVRPQRGPQVNYVNKAGDPVQRDRVLSDPVDSVRGAHDEPYADETTIAKTADKIRIPTPKPVRASSIYSHRPESANPDFKFNSAQLFPHGEEDSLDRLSSAFTSSEEEKPRDLPFCDLAFDAAVPTPVQGSHGNRKPIAGRLTRTVDEILNSYADDSNYPPLPTALAVGKIPDDSRAERSLASSTETAKRFSRPASLDLKMNNRGEDVEPTLDTPKVWKRRSQRDKTLWRYGPQGGLIQVSFEEYRDALERHVDKGEIWQCI